MKLFRLLLTVVILVHVGLCAWGAYRQSPTVDEPAYLASGLSHLEFGRFDLCRISPPLVRLVAALPVSMADAKVDWNEYRVGPGIRAEHAVGRSFVTANGRRTYWLFALGRWACIPFSLIGAWVSYRWSEALFGKPAGLISLVLWCFGPNILAHAQLLTPDVGVTALGMASCYTFWKWTNTRRWGIAAGCGLLLGLAVLAKTNAVVLIPALLAGFLIKLGITAELRKWKVLAQILMMPLICVYTINLGYGFENTCKPLGQFEFFSRTFATETSKNRFQDTFASRIPIPLPAAFLEGIDLQRRDFENSSGTVETYMRGQWYSHGWWWYYLYAMLVKVPVGVFVASIIGFQRILKGPGKYRADVLCFVGLPAVSLLTLTCSQTGFGHGLRYVLPAFPFFFIIASACVLPFGNPKGNAVGYVAVTASVVSSIFVYPHGLSYFNELAGGPRHGHFHLLDANVDWSQGFLFIDDWIRCHPEVYPLHQAHWGFLPLKELGIEIEDDRLQDAREISPGWYLISVNHLRGEYRLRRRELAEFLKFEPVDCIAYTTYVYHVQVAVPKGAHPME